MFYGVKNLSVGDKLLFSFLHLVQEKTFFDRKTELFGAAQFYSENESPLFGPHITWMFLSQDKRFVIRESKSCRVKEEAKLRGLKELRVLRPGHTKNASAFAIFLASPKTGERGVPVHGNAHLVLSQQ